MFQDFRISNMLRNPGTCTGILFGLNWWHSRPTANGTSETNFNIYFLIWWLQFTWTKRSTPSRRDPADFRIIDLEDLK